MANKTQITNIAPEAYLDGLENAAMRDEALELLALLQDVTGEAPRMWGPSIIGFGQYHYKYTSGREGDFMLAGFAARKRELVIYLMGQIPEQAELLAKLGKHRMGKACLYVKTLDDIDLEVLRELIGKSVAALKAQYPAADC